MVKMRSAPTVASMSRMFVLMPAIFVLIRGPGLPSPRFLWVPFDDALMYPLSNALLIHNSDQQAFFEDEERLLKRYYADLQLPGRPPLPVHRSVWKRARGVEQKLG